MTIYLSENLAKRLTIHCAKSDRTKSEVVSDALDRLGV
jgi:predicted transcriptional regulator